MAPQTSPPDKEVCRRKIVARHELSGPRGGRWETLKLECGHEIQQPITMRRPPTEMHCDECQHPEAPPSWTRMPIWIEGPGSILAATIGGHKLFIRKRPNGYESCAGAKIVGSALLTIDAAKSVLYRFINIAGPKLRF